MAASAFERLGNQQVNIHMIEAVIFGAVTFGSITAYTLVSLIWFRTVVLIANLTTGGFQTGEILQ